MSMTEEGAADLRRIAMAVRSRHCEEGGDVGAHTVALAVTDLLAALAAAKRERVDLVHALTHAVDKLGTAKAVLTEILHAPWHPGEPGYKAVRSGWVEVGRHEIWGQALAELNVDPHPLPSSSDTAAEPDGGGTPWDGTEAVEPEPDEAYRDHNGRIWVASGGNSAGPRRLYLAGWSHGIEPEDLDKMTQLVTPVTAAEVLEQDRVIDDALSTPPMSDVSGDEEPSKAEVSAAISGAVETATRLAAIEERVAADRDVIVAAYELAEKASRVGLPPSAMRGCWPKLMTLVFAVNCRKALDGKGPYVLEAPAGYEQLLDHVGPVVEAAIAWRLLWNLDQVLDPETYVPQEIALFAAVNALAASETWTKEEIDGAKARAKERAARLKPLIEDPMDVPAATPAGGLELNDLSCMCATECKGQHCACPCHRPATPAVETAVQP